MAVHIRLKRTGTTNLPCYRIVVTDARAPRDCRPIEELGWYDPKRSTCPFSVDLERARYWLQCGAQPSDTVRSILKQAQRTAKAA